MNKLSLTLISDDKCLYSKLLEIDSKVTPPVFELKKDIGYKFIDIIIILYNEKGDPIDSIKYRAVGSNSVINKTVNYLIKNLNS